MIRNSFITMLITTAIIATSAFATTSDLTLGKGTKDIQLSSVGVHLLRGFHFYFNRSDHHIHTIQIMPEQSRKVRLAFADKNFDDPWEIHTLFERADFTNNQEVKGICSGPCNINLNKPSGDVIFVLRGFRFSFRVINDDHHLNRLLIDENDGNLALEYSDKSRNDAYDYHIKYTWVPRSSMRLRPRQSGSSKGKQTAVELGNLERSVLRGFSFDFNSKDHHIKRIGAMIQNNHLVVDYNDKNKDDKYRWWVDYGQINDQGQLTSHKLKSKRLNTKVLIKK